VNPSSALHETEVVAAGHSRTPVFIRLQIVLVTGGFRWSLGYCIIVLAMDNIRCRGWRRVCNLCTKSEKHEDYQNNNYLYQYKKPSNKSRLTEWVWCYVLIGLTSILCYVNNVYGDFVHDDTKAITSNPDVRGETSLLTLFSNDFWGKSMSDKDSHKSYRPICVLTFR
jgi:hypothetical protein